MSINNTTPNVPLRFLEAYKKVKKDRELHITRADKSNNLVIMKKDDYDNKMTALLED